MKIYNIFIGTGSFIHDMCGSRKPKCVFMPSARRRSMAVCVIIQPVPLGLCINGAIKSDPYIYFFFTKNVVIIYQEMLLHKNL